MPFFRRAVAIGAVLGIAACSAARVDTGATADAERLYASLYPYYAEICAVSELKKKPGFGAEVASGAGGHAVMYLNGVCRDDGVSYPAIRLCGAGAPVAGQGVGLSVNAHYKNANWTATEGRDFFFHGTLKPGEKLTRAAYEQTQEKAKAMGILDGVEFHAEVFDGKPAGMSARDYKYEMSVATDYAIGFGRDRYCARVPLDRERMTRVIEYLNRLNAPYGEGRKEFAWNVFTDNCSHVSHNALAAAGLWDEWPAGRPLLPSLFDFPVPANEFVNLMRRTNDLPIESLDAVYEDAAARRALLETRSLPTGPGALAEAEPAVHDNEVYATDLSLLLYDEPISGAYRKRFERIFAVPRYVDLQANLQYFAALYRRIERARPPLAAFLDGRAAAAPAEREVLARFYASYVRSIAAEEEKASAGLASLPRSPPAVAGALP
ncbi:MAG TPA: hypothetical protein VEI03_20455 [Stellaceae bacterium]|nr:hypothetical protein [Stellaceae bacterium]